MTPDLRTRPGVAVSGVIVIRLARRSEHQRLETQAQKRRLDPVARGGCNAPAAEVGNDGPRIDGRCCCDQADLMRAKV